MATRKSRLDKTYEILNRKGPIAVEMLPQNRVTIIGKTGSGKSAFGIVYAGLWAMALRPPWEVWWLDTKDDMDDIYQLRLWGFRNAFSTSDLKTTKIPWAKYFLIRPTDTANIIEIADAIIKLAYERKNVIIVVDEFAQIRYSTQTMTRNMLNVYQRGRSRKVGIVSLVQEPVYNPRQLVSQAGQVYFFNLTMAADIEYVQKYFKEYVPPTKLGDKYGFWLLDVDNSGEYIYYSSQQDWYLTSEFHLPVPIPQPDMELIRAE